jgi:Ribosomal protein L23
MYEVFRSPVVTEKTTFISEYNQIVFNVAIDSNKSEIKQAIEGLFKVKVKSVNTLRQNGKIKRFKGTVGKRPESKKAFVTLEEGNSIDITTGI